MVVAYWFLVRFWSQALCIAHLCPLSMCPPLSFLFLEICYFKIKCQSKTVNIGDHLFWEQFFNIRGTFKLYSERIWYLIRSLKMESLQLKTTSNWIHFFMLRQLPIWPCLLPSLLVLLFGNHKLLVEFLLSQMIVLWWLFSSGSYSFPVWSHPSFESRM